MIVFNGKIHDHRYYLTMIVMIIMTIIINAFLTYGKVVIS